MKKHKKILFDLLKKNQQHDLFIHKKTDCHILFFFIISMLTYLPNMLTLKQYRCLSKEIVLHLIVKDDKNVRKIIR